MHFEFPWIQHVGVHTTYHALYSRIYGADYTSLKYLPFIILRGSRMQTELSLPGDDPPSRWGRLPEPARTFPFCLPRLAHSTQRGARDNYPESWYAVSLQRGGLVEEGSLPEKSLAKAKKKAGGWAGSQWTRHGWNARLPKPSKASQRGP